MKNMKIGTRLGLGFGSILLILVVASVFGINRLASVDSVSSDMAENRIPKLLMVKDIQQQMSIIALSYRNALLVRAPDEVMKEMARAQQATNHAGGILEKLDKVMVTPKGREQLKAVLDMRASYGAARVKFIKFLEEGKKDAARDFLASDFNTLQQAYFAQLENFQQYLIDAMNMGHQEADESYVMARNLLIATNAAAVLIGILVAFLVARSITSTLGEAVKVAETVAAGDLTYRIEVNSTDETGQLMQALKNMNDSLVKIVSQVRTGTDTIATASAQIAAGNQDLSSRTEEQASSLEETASSMEEMASTVRQSGDNAQQANKLAKVASEIAFKGGAVVADVVQTMGAINESSKKMAEIISVIDGIAFQTNILALNAAVEAARAGEQGRGFAVVATEVRNLAQRSASAAREIKVLIDDSVSKVDEGSNLVDQAGTTMTEIVTGIQRVNDIMNEITVATREQVDGIEQINQAVMQMDQVTQQNAALVEEAAAAAESMQEQAKQLVEVVSVFRMGLDVTAGTSKAVQTLNNPATNIVSTKSASLVCIAPPSGWKADAGAGDEWGQF
ncbi:MAG: methyl-accepting chemotaxis protein [Burkholderiaceae bacterium]|nr:methyl-accepting chemotaxis protein [Burkholderiaceae bacterium]